MLKIRQVLLSLLAVLAVSVIAAVPAYAHKFIIEGHEIGAGEKIAESGTQTGWSVTRTYLSSQTVITECGKGSSEGHYEAGGLATGTSKLSECEINVSGCRVREPVETSYKEELIIWHEKLAIKSTPASGGTFGESHISGSGCPISGTYAVRGSQISELPEIEVEKVEHEVITPAAGSALEVGGSPSTFSGRGTVKLVSGKKWKAN